MSRLLSNKTVFGNETSEIKFVKRILLEFGLHDEKDSEIDRIITIAKVDMTQDKMNIDLKQKNEVPVCEAQHKVLKGPMDKYVVKIKTEPK